MAKVARYSTTLATAKEAIDGCEENAILLAELFDTMSHQTAMFILAFPEEVELIGNSVAVPARWLFLEMMDPRVVHIAFLRDLASRIRRIPICHGVSGADPDELMDLARDIQNKMKLSSFHVQPEQLEKLSIWNAEQDQLVLAQQKKSFENKLSDTMRVYHNDGQPYYGSIGGSLTYSFTPNSLGLVLKVVHGYTNNELDLTDYGAGDGRRG